MNVKQILTSKVWLSDVYYQMARKGSLDFNHPGMLVLKRLSKKASNILDLGCGEGTRLNKLICGNKRGTGIDISQKAIDIAKKHYPRLNFIKSDLENIPLQDKVFDLIYSAYVLEHLSDPEKVLSEAIRLLSDGGFLVFIAPNYGAPNRCSPPFRGSRIGKLLLGFLKDLFRFSNQISAWTKVKPLTDRYFIDSDTTIEPYIRSLILFLEEKSLKIVEFNSCWSEELNNAKPHQMVFRFLGEREIYPFSLWGPHLVVAAIKK